MIPARWIPTSHNIPGFTAGIGGTELLSSLKQQSSLYGSQIRCAKVTAVTMEGEVFVVAADAPERFYSRYVLLATGVKDHLPALPGASEAATRKAFCASVDDGARCFGRNRRCLQSR